MISLLASAAALFVTVGSANPALFETGPDAVWKSLPTLKSVSASEIQRLWTQLKGGSSVAAQLAAVQKKRALTTTCGDLVDVRPLARPGQPLAGVGFRDNVRDRGWARPTMALLLADSLAQLRREFPGKTVTLGDIAQPGGGQINHGVIVRTLQDDAADAWVQHAVRHRGGWSHIRDTTASAFPGEGDRFDSPSQRVRVIGSARGHAKVRGVGHLLRIAETRYVAASVDPVQLAELEETFKRLAQKRYRVASERVLDYRVPIDKVAPTRRGGLILWHFVDTRGAYQMEVLGRGDPKRMPSLADAVEVRFARWQDKKIGSFPGEILWVREDASWSRWFQLNEAGHISHLSGIDADLSYITKDNRAHFAVDLEAMDVAATWRWFEILDETARRMKVPVEAILVDRVIRDHLRANLPMKGRNSVARHRLWSLIKVSGGHDGHHHLRIKEGSGAQERAALKALNRS